MLRLGVNAEEKGKLLPSSPGESKAASPQCHSAGAGTLPTDAKALADV